MTQTAALALMFLLYVVVPISIGCVGYWGYKRMKKPKMLSYDSIPKLEHIPEQHLPEDIKSLLTKINDKGQKLRTLYGDTNQDGKIDDKDAVNETFVIINKVLDEHISKAVEDYRQLNEMGDDRHNTQKIGHSGVTGKEALLDILTTIDTQFDDLLDAAYQSNAQKLLVTNRYLKSRFDK